MLQIKIIESCWYIFAKYGNKWNLEDEIAYVILEDLSMKRVKDDRGKGKVDDLDLEKEAEHDQLMVNQDDKGKGKVHDIENSIEKIKVDKEAKHDLNDLDDLDLDNRIKSLKWILDTYNILYILIITEVTQISSNEDVSSDNYVFGDKDVTYPLTDAEIMMFKEGTKRSRAPTRQVASTDTSNAQAASTLALRRYRKIAMIECVLSLRAPIDPNGPTSASRKRKSKKP
ncbi:hypothetical protein Tco_1097510 [Tanacetum coccineum]